MSRKSQRPDDHEDRDRDDARLQYFCWLCLLTPICWWR